MMGAPSDAGRQSETCDDAHREQGLPTRTYVRVLVEAFAWWNALLFILLGAIITPGDSLPKWNDLVFGFLLDCPRLSIPLLLVLSISGSIGLWLWKLQRDLRVFSRGGFQSHDEAQGERKKDA